MNDLDFDLVEQFRDDLPPADPASLARARARMFHDPAPRRRARWAWGLAPAGALAAAVAVAVAVGSTSDAPKPLPTTEAAPRTNPTTSEAPTAPTVPTDAAGLLRLAAAEVRAAPALPARPGQFVYVESLDATDNVVNMETDPTWVPPREKRRQVWLSVNGKKAGLLRETLVKTGKKYGDVPLDAGTPAYVTNLPTDAKGMRAWLYRGDPGTAKEDGEDAAAWNKIGDTLREQYLTPDEQAAIFEAAATIPGTKLVKQADLAGRKGVAVSLLNGSVRFDYIFDAKTYEFLGERVVVVGHLPPYPKGVVSRWTAKLKVAIVDRAGQLP